MLKLVLRLVWRFNSYGAFTFTLIRMAQCPEARRLGGSEDCICMVAGTFDFSLRVRAAQARSNVRVRAIAWCVCVCVCVGMGWLGMDMLGWEGGGSIDTALNSEGHWISIEEGSAQCQSDACLRVAWKIYTPICQSSQFSCRAIRTIRTIRRFLIH